MNILGRTKIVIKKIGTFTITHPVNHSNPEQLQIFILLYA